MLYEVRRENSDGKTLYRLIYRWDGSSDQVDVLENEINAGFDWPVPYREARRNRTEPFLDSPEDVQQEFFGQLREYCDD